MRTFGSIVASWCLVASTDQVGSSRSRGRRKGMGPIPAPKQLGGRLRLGRGQLRMLWGKTPVTSGALLNSPEHSRTVLNSAKRFTPARQSVFAKSADFNSNSASWTDTKVRGGEMEMQGEKRRAWERREKGLRIYSGDRENANPCLSTGVNWSRFWNGPSRSVLEGARPTPASLPVYLVLRRARLARRARLPA